MMRVDGIEAAQEALKLSGGEEAALCALVERLLLDDTQEPATALVEAERVARMAAATGGGRGRAKLAAVLLCRSYTVAPAEATGLYAEAVELMIGLASEGDALAAACAITNLTERADEGDEQAAELLNRIIERTPAGTLATARAAIAAATA